MMAQSAMDMAAIEAKVREQMIKVIADYPM